MANRRTTLFFVLLALGFSGLGFSGLANAIQAQPKPKYTDPEMTDEDFPVQGEYAQPGKLTSSLALQVIALGNGEFEAVVYQNGLPGVTAKKEEPKRIQSKRDGDSVKFVDGDNVYVVNGKTGSFQVGEKSAEAKKIQRQSPTLELEPPKEATVLFDGKSAELWKDGKVEGGLLTQGTTSIPKFGSHRLHIEFRIPYQPLDRGQGRGNSGIYVQGRYEVQMLDSFGLKGEQNECGGLYSVAAPSLNMCYPPLTWQTYDMDYTAAKFDSDGKLTENPRVTVRHNGVLIHDDVELPGNRSTTAAPSKPGPETGPVYLQNHGCPVRYRNIWVVETDK